MERTNLKFILSFIVLCTTIILFNVTAFPSPDFNQSGLVLLMHLNNDSSFSEGNTRVFDFSGNGNNGTPQNNSRVSLTNKIFGAGAYTFDGNEAYIDVGTDSSLDISGAMTIVAWVKVNNLSAISGVFGKMGGSGDRGYSFEVRTNGEILGASYISNTIRTTQSGNGEIVVDTWYHLAYTRRSGLQQIYKNGVSIKQTTHSGTFDTSVQVGTVGEGFNTLFMNGTIDELSIWNRILSPLEIGELYREGFCEDTLINNTNCYYTSEQYSSPLALSNVTYINSTIFYNNITVIRN